MYQDIDPNAENYHAFASNVCSNPDQAMLQMFVLALRDRRNKEATSYSYKGNGSLAS